MKAYFTITGRLNPSGLTEYPFNITASSFCMIYTMIYFNCEP